MILAARHAWLLASAAFACTGGRANSSAFDAKRSPHIRVADSTQVLTQSVDAGPPAAADGHADSVERQDAGMDLGMIALLNTSREPSSHIDETELA